MKNKGLLVGKADVTGLESFILDEVDFYVVL
jgi:hypothetical protein